jgi:hypothetical protein
VVATIKPTMRNGVEYAMVGYGQDNEVQWLGCQVDPAYAESQRQGGMLARFAFRQVSAGADVVLCAQPVSPVVQVYGVDGSYRGVIAVAPPFYVAPKDRSTTSSGVPATIDMLDFQATWTKHLRLFGTRDGFLSVYSVYGKEQNEVVYLLFGCAFSTDGHRIGKCGASRSPGKPVGLTDGSVLWVHEGSSPDGAAILVKYKVEIDR